MSDIEHTTPEQAKELRRKAAIMYLAGHTWAEIGAATNRAPGTCANWPVTHREEWQRLLQELSPDVEQVIRNKGMGAIAKLEKLADHAKSEAIRQKAAAALATLLGKTLTQRGEVKQEGTQKVRIEWVGGEDEQASA